MNKIIALRYLVVAFGFWLTPFQFFLSSGEAEETGETGERIILLLHFYLSSNFGGWIQNWFFTLLSWWAFCLASPFLFASEKGLFHPTSLLSPSCLFCFLKYELFHFCFSIHRCKEPIVFVQYFCGCISSLLCLLHWECFNDKGLQRKDIEMVNAIFWCHTRTKTWVLQVALLESMQTSWKWGIACGHCFPYIEPGNATLMGFLHGKGEVEPSIELIGYCRWSEAKNDRE